MEHEADMLLDVVGDAVVDGGLSCSTRDLARFGLAYERDGQGVIPADWVADTRDGDDEAVRNFAESPTMTNTERAGWSMYRNAFWVIERGTRYTGSGIYGQHCFIDHPSKVVVARFSTYPLPYPVDQWNETMRAIGALSEALA
jgi:CubicO group peptidase (beta-lactamase class C family)